MHELQLNQVKKLTTLLDSIGGKYKVILPDGEELGTLECKPVKEKKSRGSLYARGETAAYYVPFFAADIPVGYVVEVPYGRFDKATLAGNIYSYAHTLWGKGNATGQRNDKKGVVEVMRIG